MARIKALNLVVDYVGTDYFVNDRGADKTPRFELWDDVKKVVVEKSDNPRDFDDFMKKVWNKK